MAHSDKELLNLYRDKATRERALELIIRTYQQRLYAHIRRIVIDHDDADDVLQNVFIKMWKGLEHFREDAKLFTWLYRIATNEALSFLRKKRTRFFIPFGDVSAQLSDALTADNAYFSGDEIQLKLQKAILTLPEKQRIVFHMKYFDEMKYDEMAEILDTSVGALKASYHHAVKKIEAFLKAD